MSRRSMTLALAALALAGRAPAQAPAPTPAQLQRFRHEVAAAALLDEHPRLPGLVRGLAEAGFLNKVFGIAAEVLREPAAAPPPAPPPPGPLDPVRLREQVTVWARGAFPTNPLAGYSGKLRNVEVKVTSPGRVEGQDRPELAEVLAKVQWFCEGSAGTYTPVPHWLLVRRSDGEVLRFERYGKTGGWAPDVPPWR